MRRSGEGEHGAIDDCSVYSFSAGRSLSASCGVSYHVRSVIPPPDTVYARTSQKLLASFSCLVALSSTVLSGDPLPSLRCTNASCSAAADPPVEDAALPLALCVI